MQNTTFQSVIFNSDDCQILWISRCNKQIIAIFRLGTLPALVRTRLILFKVGVVQGFFCMRRALDGGLSTISLLEIIIRQCSDLYLT